MRLSKLQRVGLMQNERNKMEIEMRNFVDPLDKLGRTQYQIELDKRAKTKMPKRSGSKRFERSEIDFNDETREFKIRGKFVPSTQIVESHFGHARIHKTVDESGLNVSKFKPQSYSERTKNSHLNKSIKCRGQIRISGGHVKNEMTINKCATEIELGVL